jgi:ribosomal protein S18 acetylase RimI-like enzyme
MFDGKGVAPREIAVRAAAKGDAARVAQLHSTGINEGFLATLGPRFLRRLYERMAASRRAFLIVAYDPLGAGEADPREPIGFVAGTDSVARLYREFLLKDGVVAGIASAPHLVRSIPRLLETIRYGAKEAESGQPAGAGETELLSIAVAPEARRRGAGALLVDSFRAAAVRSGSSSARVVVGATNDTAIALYRSAGFVEAERFELHPGTESLLLRADLTDQCPR